MWSYDRRHIKVGFLVHIESRVRSVVLFFGYVMSLLASMSSHLFCEKRSIRATLRLF